MIKKFKNLIQLLFGEGAPRKISLKHGGLKWLK